MVLIIIAVPAFYTESFNVSRSTTDVPGGNWVGMMNEIVVSLSFWKRYYCLFCVTNKLVCKNLMKSSSWLFWEISMGLVKFISKISDSDVNRVHRQSKFVFENLVYSYTFSTVLLM